MTNRKIIVRRTLAFLGVLAVCFLTVHYGRYYIHRVWGSLRVVNFIVNLTPTILSILFAFVVDKDLEGRMKTLWRVFIVFCGLALSGLLWHQQTLADIQSDKQIQTAVNDAVTKSNAHSDAHSDQKIGDVETDLGGVKSDLQTTKQSLTALLDSSKDLKTDIGKVGTSEPPTPAHLMFTLWDDSVTADKPVLQEIVQPDSDGNFPVEFTFLNTTDTYADTIDVWIQICDGCTFAKEPDGFEKLAGQLDQVRHLVVPGLNGGVNLQKQTISVKLPRLAPFQISFHYSCKTCGKPIPPQTALITPSTSYAPVPGLQ
jgi:hypothetical protein